MLSKLIIALAVTSIAVVAMRLMADTGGEDELEREVTGHLDALREHLFKR